MTRRPKRGPLPGTTGAGRTAVLRVRVSPEEHAAYVAAAERAGVPLSEWVRVGLDRNLSGEAEYNRGHDEVAHATSIRAMWRAG